MTLLEVGIALILFGVTLPYILQFLDFTERKGFSFRNLGVIISKSINGCFDNIESFMKNLCERSDQ